MTNQSYIPSTNGLSSYIDASPEYELAPIGVASMQDQVQRLAEFGRNGDIYVIHAAEGETVIPMEVLEANPQIKSLLFNQMAEMGLDPQRYVVGDQLNSLNPVTGMPEFFFKSIFRGIKKAVKSVVKIAKKLAPVAIPIAAAMFGFPAFMGPMFGAGSIGASMLGSGLGSLIGGASLKDSLKSAAFAGITAGITGGVKGFMGAPEGSGISGFGSGLKASFTGQTPIYGVGGKLLGHQAAPSLEESWGNIFGEGGGGFFETINPVSDVSSGEFSYTGEPSPWVTGPGGLKIDPATNLPMGSTRYAPGMVSADFYEPNITDISSATADSMDPADFVSEFDQSALAGQPGFIDQSALARQAGQTVQFGTEKVYSALSGARVTDPVVYKKLQGMGKLLDSSGNVIEAGGFLGGGSGPLGLPGTGLGPAIDTALYGAGAWGLGEVTGAFDTAEEEKITEKDIPDIGGPRLTLAERQALADEQELQQASINPFLFTPSLDVEQRTIFNVAAGGSIDYPERDLLVEGPGTERSDDIPAMLSDGEFVINSRAVRGADPSGGGNRYAGAQNLYNLMRNFEMRA